MARGPSEKGRRIQRLPARSCALLIRFQAAWSSLSPDATSSDNASDSTSATVLTGWMWISQRRTYSGTSSRSGSLRRGTMTSVRPARWAASSFCIRGWQQRSTHRHASRPPSGRVQTTFSSHVRARSSGSASTWATSRSSDVLPVPAGAEITDDSACDGAIERIQKSAAIGFRRVALVPQSEPSSAATTTLSAVDLFCTASLVLARAYSARTAGHVR